MPRRLLATLALVLPALAGCAREAPAADPLVMIAGPKLFQSFELQDEAERVIWRLVAEEPAPVSELVYGEVPAGFRQEVPADGSRPRSLTLGELLRLESVTPRRLFEHEGLVASGGRLSIDQWRMTLRNPPPREVDDEPGES